MKKWWIVSVLLVVITTPMVGCVSWGGDGNWQDNAQQIKGDVFLFSKMATRIALTEAEMPARDVELIESYLIALQDLLIVPGQPDFTGARALVIIKLPYKYKIYGLTIIDVLERYITAANLDITNDQELIINLISSGINGAITAVHEFSE